MGMALAKRGPLLDNGRSASSTMTKYKLEYIWLDGKHPVPGLRGKTLLKAFDQPPTLADLPNWGFDGSSTLQAEGKSSDCVLKPVALYPDGSRKDAFIDRKS